MRVWMRMALGGWCLVLVSGCINVGTFARVDAQSTVAGEDSVVHGATGFINKTVNVDGRAAQYVVYVPRDYDPAKAWPLVLFLHGAGERGNDGLAQSEVGLGRAIRLAPDRFPCVVVMPQCPKDIWWDEATDIIAATLDATLSQYSIDRDRVYLTGLSMGGFGTWQYGARHADTFAALMPICGGGHPEDAGTLATVPIWAFHGAKDSVVKVDETRRMVDAVKQAGGLVRYTEYPDLDHNSWDAAYGDAEAIRWLLAQRKNGHGG